MDRILVITQTSHRRSLGSISGHSMWALREENFTGSDFTPNISVLHRRCQWETTGTCY
jgi:hypothetical protein